MRSRNVRASVDLPEPGLPMMATRLMVSPHLRFESPADGGKLYGVDACHLRDALRTNFDIGTYVRYTDKTGVMLEIG